jgi:subtilisin family serine protease
MKPNIAAPGSSVRSSYYLTDQSYTTMGGTSMAGPHVAGLVALIISADPGLRGDVNGIRDMIEQSAVRRTTAQGCGGDSPTAAPNNVYGWGRIDAYAATCGGLPPTITDLQVTKLNAMDLQLTWSATAHATTYRVQWNTSPYFAPEPTCLAGACETVATTGSSQAALGDISANYTYLVRARNRCGEMQSAASNRVGEFGFPLVGGGP